MTDEHIRMLDVRPQELPYVILRGAFLPRQVTSDLDMTPVENGPIRGNFLDQWNKSGHLRIIDLASLVRFPKIGRDRLTKMTSAPPSSGGLRGPPSENQ
jgi:hypothetical protein